MYWVAVATMSEKRARICQFDIIRDTFKVRHDLYIRYATTQNVSSAVKKLTDNHLNSEVTIDLYSALS